jgi:hypothetical protein
MLNEQENKMASQLAYQNTSQAIERTQKFKDPACVGTSLVENLLHERAFSLDHFASEADQGTRAAKMSKD